MSQAATAKFLFKFADPSIAQMYYPQPTPGMVLQYQAMNSTANAAPENSRPPHLVKGKAAIDVVCNPLGKSGGALIQQFMILTFGSLANSTPYLGGILLVIVLTWIGATRSLDQQFTALAKEDLQEKEGKPKEGVIDVSQKSTNGTLAKEETVNGSIHEGGKSELNGLPLEDTLAGGPETSSETNIPRDQ